MTISETRSVEDAVFDLRRGQTAGALAVLTNLLDRTRHGQTGNTTTETEGNSS